MPETPPERKVENAGTVASFYGVPVRSDRVLFVLDRSASMGAWSPGAERRTRLQAAAAEVNAAVGKLRKDARFNVILFSSDVEPWQPRLVPANEATRAALARDLAAEEPNGGTNLYDALDAALRTSDVDTVFVVSDGQPCGGRTRSGAWRSTRSRSG